MPSFFVHAARLVPEEDLDHDDGSVHGVYQVDVECEADDPHAVTAVLDAFHDHVGIASLEDFEIGVKNEAGEWVCESDNEDDPDPEDMPKAIFQGDTDDEPDCESRQDLLPRSRPSP